MWQPKDEKEALMFRPLSDEEEIKFRAWSRENFKAGDPIDALWHPVTQDEYEKMNSEKLQADYITAARDAITVQDACNISGVVNSLFEVLTKVLYPMMRKQGKDGKWAATHPITKLFVYKIADLAQIDAGFADFSEAYKECRKIAGME